MSNIDDEIRRTREKMLSEKRKQEEDAAAAKRLSAAFEAANMSPSTPQVIMPSPAVREVIQEVIPKLSFRTGAVVRTMPNGITYIRKSADKERPTDRMFDVTYKEWTRDKTTYRQFVWILPNGSIALSGMTAEELDPQQLRTRVIETIAEQSISRSSSSRSSSSGNSSSSGSKKGCYVATAVYGSYNCPEVWVLRRYRDQVLMNSISGRCFVKLYYAVSPALVRLFGNARWFSGIIRPLLDRKVMSLKAAGYRDTEYQDSV